jgi:hypothetical protein
MVALAPSAATLSDSRALWLTGVVGLTAGLLSGGLDCNFEIPSRGQKHVAVSAPLRMQKR